MFTDNPRVLTNPERRRASRPPVFHVAGERPATTSILLALFILIPYRAFADTSDEAERVRAQLKTQATQIVTDTLRVQCPDRCSLIDVHAEVDVGQPLARVQPGFEELSPQVHEVKPRSVELTVLMDARLPAEFRKDLTGLLKERLRALPVAASVKTDYVPFPQPIAPPAPPSVESKPPAPPPAETKPTLPPTAETKPPPFDPYQALLERLIGAAPWLLGLVLVAATLLLIVRSLRAPQEEDDEEQPPAPPVSQQKESAPPVAPVAAIAQRLNDELRDNPRLRVTLFKELLVSGEEDKVARYVQLLGPSVADGLREDPSCRAALRRISTNLRIGVTEVPDEESRQLLKELEGRLMAARLEGVGGAVDDAFAFLDKLTPSQFRRLLEEASPRGQGAALRFAPGHLREAALAEMEPTRRRALFLATAEAGTPSAPELANLADELRLKASRLAPGGDAQGVDLLVDLLESQGPLEQKALLDSLAAKPGVRQAIVARLLTENTLLRIDDDLLASAVAAVDVNALVGFLRGADASVRARLLAVCPRPMGDALREELSLEVTATQAQFLAGRRQVFQATRQLLQQRGVSLETLNSADLRAVG